MSEYDGDARPLPWPIRDPLVYSRTTEADPEHEGSAFVWPEDSDERVPVVFNLSLNEFVVLASAVDAGSDIAYGEDAIRVWWLWDRVLRVPMSLCDAIIDCITNNPATRAAIVDMLKADEDFNQWFTENVYRLTEGQIVGKLVIGDCDDSVVAGRAIAIVNRLATNAEDFLEVLEVGTNDEERIADFLEGIPLFGELPVGDTLNIMQDVLEDFGENFSAANTTGRREQLARLIWCKMLEDPECTITFQGLYELLNELALSGLAIDATVQDLLEFITDGDFDNDDLIFHGLLAIEVGFVLQSKDFYGVNIGNLGAVMADAPPSSLWESWDPCGPAASFNIIATYPGPIPVTCTFLGKEGTDDLWLLEGTTTDLPVEDSELRPIILVDAYDTVPTSYQHQRYSDNVIVSGSGIGESPPTWKRLGFVGTATTTIRISTP